MGGPPVWKEIIDNFNALAQVVGCMAESIRIAGSKEGSGVMPTNEQRDKFIAASNALANVASEIEKHVSAEK